MISSDNGDGTKAIAAPTTNGGSAAGPAAMNAAEQHAKDIQAFRRHKAEKAMRKEFKAWKRQLTDMIKKGSTIVARANDWGFLLPPALVKLVWQTTIKERVAYQESMGLEGDKAHTVAIESLRDEVDQAASQLQAKLPPRLIEVLKLSQLAVAWDILSSNIVERPITFQDLGKALNEAGVKIVNDMETAPNAVEEHRAKQAEVDGQLVLMPPDEEDEQAAADSLAQTRADLVGSLED